MQTRRGEKRAFLNQFETLKDSSNGWIRIKIEIKNGKIYTAQDYVVIDTLPQAQFLAPKDNAEETMPPKKLSWRAVPGAKYYQVYIRNFWNDEKVIFTSKLLNKPDLTILKGALHPGDCTVGSSI